MRKGGGGGAIFGRGFRVSRDTGFNYLFEVFFSMKMNIYTLNIKTTQYPCTMTFMGARDTKKSNNVKIKTLTIVKL